MELKNDLAEQNRCTRPSGRAYFFIEFTWQLPRCRVNSVVRSSMRALLLLLAVLYWTKADVAAYIADGYAYVPVLVLVTVEDTGITNGIEVRLTGVGEESQIHDDELIFRNIQKNLGKPVKTDQNSTAVVWMLTGWTQTSDPNSYRRVLRGKLIVGPIEAPLFEAALRDVIEDVKQAESSTIPMTVIVKLKKEAVQGNAAKSSPKIEQSGRDKLPSANAPGSRSP